MAHSHVGARCGWTAPASLSARRRAIASARAPLRVAARLGFAQFGRRWRLLTVLAPPNPSCPKTRTSQSSGLPVVIPQQAPKAEATLDRAVLIGGNSVAFDEAIAQALVNYLRDKGATTFIATHYPELKVYASQTVGATNASLMFDEETL